jgi:hypothetical protein
MSKVEEPTFPRWWSWDDPEDGDSVAGTFVRAGKGFTEQGERTFITILVDDEERTVWLFNDVLANAFSREVYRRPDKQLHVGELIEIDRLGERQSKSSSRTYRNYSVRFPQAPQPSHADVFGPPPERSSEPTESSEPDPGADDGDIPF